MKKKKSKIEPLKEDEITLFDAVLQMIAEMSPEEKKWIVKVLFFLVACEDDGKLNMNNVRTLLNKASDGTIKFDN